MKHKSRLPTPQSNATPATPSPSEKLVRDIRRITRKHYSSFVARDVYCHLFLVRTLRLQGVPVLAKAGATPTD